MDLREVGMHPRFGKFGPDFARRRWRIVAFGAEQQAGFLGHFAHGGERDGTREGIARVLHPLQ